MDVYEQIAQRIGRLVDEKQAAYGNSFGRSGDVLRILYPGGVDAEQYDDLLAVARIIDKLFRVATSRDALGENPYQDIAGYGILGAANGPLLNNEHLDRHMATSESAPHSDPDLFCNCCECEAVNGSDRSMAAENIKPK